jgi:putative PIN family toxin of toxin-antitoxin system
VKVVLDTNVFISGIFFRGAPQAIMTAWGQGLLQLVVSRPILEEYDRVGRELSTRMSGFDLAPVFQLLDAKALVVESSAPLHVVREDPSDDKFLECALEAGKCPIVSGDRHLLKYDNFRGIAILKPRSFVDQYLK